MSRKPGAVRMFLRACAGSVGALWGKRFHWPAVWILCALALALVFGVDLIPARVFAVTVSIDAASEVLELELDPRREYVWSMPAGAYSLVTAGDAKGCTATGRFEVSCAYADSTAMILRNGPTVRLEVTTQASGPPRFTLSLIPRAGATAEAQSTAHATSFEIRGNNDEPLAATSDYVGYESAPVERWRIPLTLTHLQIGESLRDNVIAPDDEGAREPIMLRGNVRIFARRAFSTGNRYQVQEERFDPADVVQVPEPRENSALLLGLLSLNASDNAFDLTVHTDGTRILVRRLGAGHAIGASMWSIVSKDPAMLALWAALIALLGLTNYHSQRLNNRLARQAAADAAAQNAARR
jgi:hypothetical protein